MNELVVVANRGPAKLEHGEGGELVVRHGAGGLAPSLARALAGTGALWLAAPMTAAEEERAASGEPVGLDAGIELRLVDLPEEVRAAAYRVVANGTLWFCYHGLFDHVRRPVLDRHWHAAWEGYRAYNAAFASEVARHAAPGATVVVNDYHLALVGTHLARERPDLRTVHFTHTPFCSPAELRVLPSAIAAELCEGLASFGACGFHTERWAAAFRACAAAFAESSPSCFAAPLGTDAAELRALAASSRCVELTSERLDWLAGRRLVLRNDRVELSKNIVRGFLAYEELLLAEPEWRERAVFVARAYPSREELPEYRAYRSEVERVVERVNSRFGTGEFPPIVLEIADDFEASLAAAACYDVLLVNPIRDGMNLVAREGPVVNTRDGVLALSREAGAFEELGAGALAVEPFDVSGTAAVLGQALAMSSVERSERAGRLRALAPGLAPADWFAAVVREARTPS